MTNCETIRCRTRGYNSAYLFIALEKQAFKVLPPINSDWQQGISLRSMKNKFKLCGIHSGSVEETSYNLHIRDMSFFHTTELATNRTTHHPTHIKLPATKTEFNKANFGHAALLCSIGGGAHRRVSCGHPELIFVDGTRCVHCGHSCLWPSHHHGLSPTAHAPKFRRAALV